MVVGEMYMWAFGGLAGGVWKTTDFDLYWSSISYDNLVASCSYLYKQVKKEISDNTWRFASVPYEGVSDDYKARVAIGLYFKAGIAVLKDNDVQIPAGEESAGEVKWGTWGG
jgi:xanthine dehydrogenase/oxidase